MKEKNYDYYIPIAEQAVAEHKSGGTKITTSKTKEEMTIHDDEVFTQCYIPREQEEEDRKGIRSQLRRRYFISEKYCQLIEVDARDEDNPKVYWIKEDLTGGYNRPRFKIMQDKKDQKYWLDNGIATYTLYGIVFGCYMTIQAKRRLKKNVYQAIGNTEGCIHTHHIVPFKDTKEPEENGHIYDISEMEIITYEEHQLLDKNPNKPTIPRGDSNKQKFDSFTAKVNTAMEKEENNRDYILTVISKSGREQELITIPLNLFVTINSTVNDIENDIALYESFTAQAGDKLVDAINNTRFEGTHYLKIDICDKLTIDVQKRVHKNLETGFFKNHTPYKQYIDGKDPEECSVTFMYSA